MKFTTILSGMLYAATAVVAAPVTIERRTSYTGGTTANDVVNKGSKDDNASFDGKSLTPAMQRRVHLSRSSSPVDPLSVAYVAM